MKIAVIAEIINYHSGARAPLEIAKHLAKRNHTVTIYAYDYWQDQNTRNDILQGNISLVTLKKAPIPFIGKCITAFSLFRILKKSPPQVIAFAGTLPFFLASKLTRLPILLMYHGIQPNAYLEKKNPDEKITIKDRLLNEISNIYIYLINGIIIYLATDIVTISRFAAREIEKLYRKKVHAVIYLGTTSFSSGKKPLGFKKPSITILSVSRITPYKGFHLIIEAMKKVKTNKKVMLTIVGSQPKHKYLEYLKKLGGNNVKILLDPSDKKLSKIYQQSDLYVNADRYLYFGLPIYEAAQFGKPTVSFNFAAAEEMVVHNKTGLTAHDMKEFVNYLTKLIDYDSLRNALGRNALQRTKEYTWEICAKNWETVLKKFATQTNDNTS